MGDSSELSQSNDSEQRPDAECGFLIKDNTLEVSNIKLGRKMERD